MDKGIKSSKVRGCVDFCCCWEREWEWEWQLSSDSSASMLAVAPSVHKRFIEGGDNVLYFASYKLLGPKLDKVIGCRVLLFGL